jgi:hypothetical protein
MMRKTLENITESALKDSPSRIVFILYKKYGAYML